jgi:hypothetical protein
LLLTVYYAWHGLIPRDIDERRQEDMPDIPGGQSGMLAKLNRAVRLDTMP